MAGAARETGAVEAAVGGEIADCDSTELAEVQLPTADWRMPDGVAGAAGMGAESGREDLKKSARRSRSSRRSVSWTGGADENLGTAAGTRSLPSSFSRTADITRP